MSYATIEDVQKRCRRTLSATERTVCETLLEDAAVIVDAYNKKAPEDAKKMVSCNMIIRAIGDGESAQVPIGSTQGTVSALGYSQTWTMGNGSTGELYLSKLDKKVLGTSCKIGFMSPFFSGTGEDDD